MRIRNISHRKLRVVARAVTEEEPGAGHVNIIGSVQ